MYTLGISKFQSSTLTLGEMGRYPIAHRAILMSILYWLRVEQGTSNVLLNKAYEETRKSKKRPVPVYEAPLPTFSHS